MRITIAQHHRPPIIQTHETKRNETNEQISTPNRPTHERSDTLTRTLAGVLLSQELKSKNIPVVLLHPGFNKTGMTAKYAAIWEKEGAVDAAVGAMRVLHEVGQISMATSGKFINCEDGLQIPW